MERGRGRGPQFSFKTIVKHVMLNMLPGGNLICIYTSMEYGFYRLIGLVENGI